MALSGAGRFSEFGPASSARFKGLPVSIFAWSKSPHELVGSRLRWLWDTYSKTPAGLRWYFARHPLRRWDVVFVYGRSYFRLRRVFGVAEARGAFSVLDLTEGLERFAGFGGASNPVYWDWAMGTKFLARRANLVTAISTGLAERAKAAGATRVMLLPGIEEWTVSPPELAHNIGRSFRLLVFGALSPKDDPALLEKVTRELARRQVPVSVELVGRYNESREGRRWSKKIVALGRGLTEVRLNGGPTEERLPGVLAEADGFLMLRSDSVAEMLAFPTRLVELLKMGRPILVSDVGDVAYYLKHRQHVLLVPAGDVVSVSNMIEEVVRLPDRGRQIGLDGWAQGRRCFDRDTRVKAVLSAIWCSCPAEQVDSPASAQ